MVVSDEAPDAFVLKEQQAKGLKVKQTSFQFLTLTAGVAAAVVVVVVVLVTVVKIFKHEPTFNSTKEHKTKYRTTSRSYSDLFTALTDLCFVPEVCSEENCLPTACQNKYSLLCFLLLVHLIPCGLSHFFPKFHHLTMATHTETTETEHTCQNNVCILVFKWFNIYLHSHRWRTNKETKGVKAIILTNLNKNATV